MSQVASRRMNWLVIGGLMILVTASPMMFAAKPAEKRPVKDYMQAINANATALARQISDKTKNADSLRLVTEMQEYALFSKAGVPTKAGKLPEAEQKTTLIGYRKGITQLLTALSKVELALLDDDNAAAATAWAEAKAAQSANHPKYR